MKNPACDALKQILIESVNLIIAELQTINNKELIKVLDPDSPDANTRSVQTILTHVIYAGNRYVYDISENIEQPCSAPEKLLFNSADEYKWALENLISNIEVLFVKLTDDILEQTEEKGKILSPWKQRYDIEQLLEHAIVHNLRHARQIRNLRKKFGF